MDTEFVYFVAILLLLSLTVISGVLVGTQLEYNHIEAMSKMGYEQRAMPGTDKTLWQKREERSNIHEVMVANAK